MITITETGTTQIVNRLTTFVKTHPQLVATALKIEAQDIMSESKLEVPVDTGSLRDSGYIKEPVISANNVSITLGYGGNNVRINPKSGQATNVYAVEVHENVQVAHRTGKAKFLIDPIERNSTRLAERLLNIVERLL